MSRASEALSALPDETRVAVLVGSGDLTLGELRDVLARPPEFRVLTTGQAADMLGYSPDTWRAWAEDGSVRDAYRDDGDSGTWRLPQRACEEHLARLQSDALKRRRKRGPWPKAAAQTPQAPRAGAAPDPEGKVVELRPQTMGRRKADASGPQGTGLA